MLDMGFIPDIERIVKLVPFTRQTLFFSATMPPEIEKLSNQFLQNPVSVEVAPPATASKTITQRAVAAPIEDFEKRAVLRSLIDSAEDLKNAIIFCNRKVDVAALFRSLDRHGYSAGALHGDMDQSSRTAMLDRFKKGEIKLLVASDVAARGLDLPDVSHIYNFDVPVTAEDYVHRIGRTGRAGRKGASFTIATPVDQKAFEAIEKLIGETIEWEGEPVEWDARAGRRGRGGRSTSDRGASGGRKATGGRKSADKPAKTVKPASDAPAEKDEKPRRDSTRKKTASSKPRRDTGKPAPRGGRELVTSDDSHAFGGEEHVPDFLRR